MRRALDAMIALLVGTVVALAISLAFARPASGQRVLPPYPKVVHTTHGDIRIEWMPHEFDCGGVSAIGCTTYASRRIQIVKGMSVEQTWVTIEHETYHMKFHDYGIKFPSQDAEDEVCDRLATARVFEMMQGAGRKP